MSTRKILITGATGSVSGALLDSLPATGGDYALRALVRDPAKAQGLAAKGIELAQGDLEDPESLPRAFEGVHTLWLLTPVGPRAPENNMNAMWAARQAGVKRVVRMSAIGAAYDAPSRNGRLHALSDAEVQGSGMRWTILRPHFFMQNLLGSAQTVSTQGAMYWAMGEGKLGMIDARDIGASAAAVLKDDSTKHDGKIYTPTGPASITFAEAATQLSEVIGKPVKYVPLSFDAAREAMLGMGMPAWLTGMLVEYSRGYASNWGDFTNSHVKDLTGQEPRSFATFAKDHAKAFVG